MDVADIKKLREATGGGILECKKALESSGGDYQKAYDILMEKGVAKAAKRESKDAHEGLVGTYIHSNGKIGSMVELNCETDFVARNDVFKQLLKDICMQVAALNPVAVQREDVPEEIQQKKKELFLEEAKGTLIKILKEFKEKEKNIGASLIKANIETKKQESLLAIVQSARKEN